MGDNMFSMVRTSHPATGVEHRYRVLSKQQLDLMITFSLSCSFFHLGEKNLVVAGADILRVFQMVPEVTSNTC